MLNIRFSVIIPAYNAASTIEATLASLRAQHYPPFEVIIVDDHSADSEQLAAIVQQAINLPLAITLVRSTQKLNGAGARNWGLSLARGDYVCFLDADDLWRPTKLACCAQVITQLAAAVDPQRVILFSQVNIYQDGEWIKVMPPRAPCAQESIAEYLFGCYGFMQTSSLVMARDAALRIGFDARFTRHQDYDFCIRADRLGYRFHFIAAPLVDYHLRAHFASQHKGESVAYSRYWLDAMAPWLTRRDRITYHAYKLPLRYRMDGRPVAGLLCFLRAFFFTSRTNQRYFMHRLLSKIEQHITARVRR